MKADRELRKRLVSILAGFIFHILAIAAVLYVNIHLEKGYLGDLPIIYLINYLLATVFFGIGLLCNENNNYNYFNLEWFYIGYAPLFALAYYIIIIFVNIIKNYIDD